MALSIPVTVAVCTFQRPAGLARALGSLLSQQPAAAEILVVDNGPGGVAGEQVQREFPGVRVVREPVPGLDFARNRALAEATNDIVLFLDDDAVAGDAWVDNASRALREDPHVGASTGRVEPLTLESKGQQLFEANGGFSRGTTRIRLPGDAVKPLHGHRAPLIAWAVSVGSGCGLGVRRAAALEVGGFDQALDLGPALPGGGDHDMLWRLLQAGYDVVYEPKALAHHEHRREVAEAEDQIVGHQRALIALLTKQVVQTGGARRWTVAAFLGWRLIKPGVRLARRLAGRDPLPARLLLRMWAHCWMGLGSYSRGEALARRRIAEVST